MPPLLSRLGTPLVVAFTSTVTCAAVWIADPTTPGGPLAFCPIKLLLGIDCPGCGGLRMLYSLLHGNLAAAVAFNALALFFLALLLWAYGVWCYGRLRGRQVRTWLQHRWTPAVVVALASAWFVVRNIPIGPFTTLRV